jgi:hypothetical protein
MSKEPGQMLWELQRSTEQMHWPWCNVADGAKVTYAAVESAIRADEAAKVRAATIEECAKICEDEKVDDPPDNDEDRAYNMAISHAAAAIRAKGAEHGMKLTDIGLMA